jgi:glycerate-2-kinase
MAQAALESVDAYWCTRKALSRLQAEGVGLHGCVVYAFGKASHAMARAALDEIQVRKGIVHTFENGRLGPLTLVKSGHPVPLHDAAVRGAELLNDAEQLTENDVALCLVSGGGSAMLEAPREGFTLETIQQRTAEAMRSGIDILELNKRRATWSRVKGGGLARAIAPARLVNVVISDVPTGEPTVVASGPTFADDIPHITEMAADNRTAVQAAAHYALRQGVLVHTWPDPISDDAAVLGQRLQAYNLSFVAGGETTVQVRGDGIGGRNQHLVLGALSAFSNGLTLSLATDGVDGPTDAAGAFVDSAIVRLPTQSDIRDAFTRCDSYTLLKRIGALLHTGPTGTNVADVVIRLAS